MKKFLIVVLVSVLFILSIPISSFAASNTSAQVFSGSTPTPAPTSAPMPQPTPLWDFWLTVSSSEGGEVLGEGFYHFHNTNPWPSEGLTIEALPNEGWKFDGWYDGAGNLITTQNPFTFIGGYTSVTAIFSPLSIPTPTPKPTPMVIKATKVKTFSTLYLVKGKTITLPAAVQPYNAADKGVTWKSSDKKIATVNDKGKVKGVKAGKATLIVATNDGKKTAKCTVYVVNKATAIKSFTITPNKATNLGVGKTMQVRIKMNPAKATGIVPTYKPSKKNVAVIDAMGVITALKPGKTTVTVTVGKIKKTFVLTVVKQLPVRSCSKKPR